MIPDRDLRITEAAIQFDGKTYTGRRHGQIMQAIWMEYAQAHITADMQGFVSQDRRFWNRFQAGAIAYQAGQTATRRPNLLSEDLW